MSINFKIFARKNGGQFAPVSGGQFDRFMQISPKSNFKFFSVFADKNENPFLPGSNWDLTFTELNGITKVSIIIHNDSLERMEKMIEMGFKEGFTATLNELENRLSKL